MVSEEEVEEFIQKPENYKEFMRRHMGLEPPFDDLKTQYPLPNGQQADNAILQEKEVQALIESKGDTGLHDFLTGTAQAQQGTHQIKLNLYSNFSPDAKSFLLVPKELADKLPLKLFDIRNFTLVFVDIKSGETTEYDPSHYTSSDSTSWITINANYFRDSSLLGVYFYLKLMLQNSALPAGKRLSLNGMEEKIKVVRDSNSKDFFGDIRNNHIVPSKWGFWNSRTKSLTQKGYKFAKMSFQDFCEAILLHELGEFSRAVFFTLCASPVKTPYSDSIAKFIAEEIYQGQKVTYLHDPDGKTRNIGTIIRMLETIGAIKRMDGKIKINYYPLPGMPFRMSEFNSPEYTGDIYSDDLINFWFGGNDEFNFDFDY